MSQNNNNQNYIQSQIYPFVEESKQEGGQAAYHQRLLPQAQQQYQNIPFNGSIQSNAPWGFSQQQPINQGQYQPVTSVQQVEDQLAYKVKKSREGVKKWGKCQLYFSYLLVGFGTFYLFMNLASLLFVDEWAFFPYESDDGSTDYFTIDSDGIIFLTMIACLLNGLMIALGLQGLKIFRPILKEAKHQQYLQVSNVNTATVKKSKQIKMYRSMFVKSVIVGFVLFVLGCLFARDLVGTTVDDMIDAQYDSLEYQSTALATTNFDFTNVQEQNIQEEPPLQRSNALVKYDSWEEWLADEEDDFNADYDYDYDYEIEDFDFDFGGSTMTKDEAKEAAHSLIDFALLAIIAYMGFVGFCVTVCCLKALKTLKKHQKDLEKLTTNNYLQAAEAIQGNQNQQPNQATAPRNQERAPIIPQVQNQLS